MENVTRIFYFCLFLTSLSSLAESSCAKVKKELYSLSKATTKEDKLRSWSKKLGANKNVTAKLLALGLEEEDINALVLSGMTSFPKTPKKLKQFHFYLQWSLSFSKKKRVEKIKDVKGLFAEEPNESIQKFLAYSEQFNKYEKKRHQHYIKKFQSESLTENKIQNKARKFALKDRNDFERLKFSCRSRTRNEDNGAASKNFRRFIMTIGPISTVTAFTFANKEELKDAIKEEDKKKIQFWFKRLGYEVGLGVLLGHFFSKIFSDPSGNYFVKVLAGYKADMIIGSFDAFLYSLILGQDKKERDKRYKKLIENPNWKEELLALDHFLDKRGIFAIYRDTVFNLFKEKFGGFESIEDIDLEKVSDIDLESPEVKVRVLQAITAQMYDEFRGQPEDKLEEHIYTGEKGVDRLLFFGEVGPLYHSANIGIGYLIYNTICMGKNNLKQAYLKAAVISTAWSFGYNLFEFPMRTKMIDQ